MSGICAIVSFDGSRVAREDLEAMTGAAPHRGRARTRAWYAPGTALAHQATQLTAWDRIGEHPLLRSGLALVADARIDNRDELVPALIERGYLAGEVATTSDAEVILASHRCWGDRAPARLIGDFAYVLWDARRRRLLAARDPMGMRPLYYRIEPRRRTMLASEVKQLLAVPGVPGAIDERGIVATLAGPYLPADATVYEGVGQVAPGSLLVVDADGSRVVQFWSPDAGSVLRLDEDAAVEAYRAALARAVGDRLQTERPVGLLLSGGMDSGSIAAMSGWLTRQGRASGAGLRTYSWAFPSMPDADERSTSDAVVSHFGLTDTAVEGDDAWPLAGYPDGAPDRDDPFIWPYQMIYDRSVARAAADGVGLLVAGNRGDELVGDWIFDELGLARAGHVRRAFADLRLAARLDGRSVGSILRGHVIRPALWDRARPVAELLDRRRRTTRPWAPWIPDAVARRVDLGDVIADATRVPRFDGHARSLRHQRLFMTQAARIATLGERTHARSAIGYADPFADRRLVELVLALPQWQVQRRGRPKHIAREAMRGIMPEDALQRVGKAIPVSLFERGLRDRAVPTARSLLTGTQAGARGWLSESVARDAYEGFVRTGVARFDFWWPLTVEWWLRRWWS